MFKLEEVWKIKIISNSLKLTFECILGTTFPLLGIKAEAKKGSAIFWINLVPYGKTNKLTYHGGCPVLVGSKWITNKWIYYNNQFSKFPCKLNLHEHNHGAFEKYRQLQKS